MNNQGTISTGLNRFYAKVYGYLGGGLALSAIISYLALQVYPQQVFSFINNFPLGFMGLWIVELILVVVLGVKAAKNPSLAIGGFIAYSLLNGLTLAVTLAMYDIGSITRAFITATGMFLGMSVVGLVTKKDLTGVSRAGMARIDRCHYCHGLKCLYFTKQRSRVVYFSSFSRDLRRNYRI